MKCSFLELYNEQFYDLLNPGTALRVRSTNEKVIVVGASECDVTSYEKCMKHLWQGWNQRKVAETSMNRDSSRSHAIFTLTLKTTKTDGAVVKHCTSRLNLIDLAGNERQGQTKVSGVHLQEAGNINKSLSVLARVIRTLASAKPGYISYRDSMLTLLLRDSLGGNSRTAVVVNVHPDARYIGDTRSTLEFAQSIKKIRNSTLSNTSASLDLEILVAENAALKTSLEAALAKVILFF